jgi:5,10-methylenetetrahydrofolate reductase
LGDIEGRRRRGLEESIKRRRHPIMVELPTPRGVDCSHALSFARKGEEYVDAFLVPDVPTGRVRADPVAVSKLLLDAVTADVVSSISVRHHSLEANISRMLGLWIVGVRNLNIVMGDALPGLSFPEHPSLGALKAIRLAKSMADGWVETSFGRARISGRPRFFVGCALLPNRRGEEERVKAKVDAGADFFITQVSFEHYTLASFFDRLASQGFRFDRPVFVALAVMKAKRSLEALRGLDGLYLPEKVAERLLSSNDLEEESIGLGMKVFHEAANSLKGRVKLGAYVLPLNGSGRSLELARGLSDKG